MIFKMTRLEWAHHFKNSHTMLPGVASVEEMMLYPNAFAKVKADHDQLHARYHTGHEHNAVTGRPIDPPKKKPQVVIVDD